MWAGDGYNNKRSPPGQVEPGVLHAQWPCGWWWPCCAAGHWHCCPWPVPPAPLSAAAPSTASPTGPRPGIAWGVVGKGVSAPLEGCSQEKIFVVIIYPVVLRSGYICRGLASEKAVSWLQGKRLGHLLCENRSDIIIAAVTTKNGIKLKLYIYIFNLYAENSGSKRFHSALLLHC